MTISVNKAKLLKIAELYKNNQDKIFNWDEVNELCLMHRNSGKSMMAIIREYNEFLVLLGLIIKVNNLRRTIDNVTYFKTGYTFDNNIPLGERWFDTKNWSYKNKHL